MVPFPATNICKKYNKEQEMSDIEIQRKGERQETGAKSLDYYTGASACVQLKQNTLTVVRYFNKQMSPIHACKRLKPSFFIWIIPNKIKGP